MNRRKFLVGAATLIGGIALEDAIPVGRIFSFPKEIKLASSLMESKHFIVQHLLVDENRAVEAIYNGVEFYHDRHAVPIKVRFVPMQTGFNPKFLTKVESSFLEKFKYSHESKIMLPEGF